MCLIVTWTICRGWTERVGKFPRPWTGTVSPRIESKRCTCSQDNTQNRRHCSDTSPEDMAMERTTELYKNAKTSDLLRQITPPSNTWVDISSDEDPKQMCYFVLPKLSLSTISQRVLKSSSCAHDSLFPIRVRSAVPLRKLQCAGNEPHEWILYLRHLHTGVSLVCSWIIKNVLGKTCLVHWMKQHGWTRPLARNRLSQQAGDKRFTGSFKFRLFI